MGKGNLGDRPAAPPPNAGLVRAERLPPKQTKKTAPEDSPPAVSDTDVLVRDVTDRLIRFDSAARRRRRILFILGAVATLIVMGVVAWLAIDVLNLLPDLSTAPQ